MVSIKDYGAAGDGKTLDTAAVQAAIDACAAAGGGMVAVPEGVFVCGTIRLASHVHLWLELGAVLKATEDLDAYASGLDTTRGDLSITSAEQKDCLIYARGAEDISITGEGRVIGNGQADWGSWWGIRTPLEKRIGLLLFEDCSNVSICGVSFLYSEFWTLHLSRCENVEIDHVKIRNNYHRLNTDGIDPNSCKNVIISNCHIVAGDDCIVAKTADEKPTENMTVCNCILETPNTAIKIGTESRGDFRDLHFDNCVIAGSAVGIGIFAKDGGVVERVTFSNISVRNRGLEAVKPVLPLFIDIEKRDPDSRVSKVRDISFQNIQVESEMGALFQGLPYQKLENISLSHITFRVPADRSFAGRKKAVTGRRTLLGQQDTVYIQKPAYLSFAHINGLHLDDITVVLEREGEVPKAGFYFCDISRESLGALKRVPERPAWTLLRDEDRDENCLPG